MKTFKKAALLALILSVWLVGCSDPYIEQNVNFSHYDRNGEEIYDVKTYVWGEKKWDSFIQWHDVDYNIKTEDIEITKAKQMKEAKEELTKLLKYQAN